MFATTLLFAAQAALAQPAAPASQPARKDGPPRTRAWGVRLDSEPPEYVRTLPNAAADSPLTSPAPAWLDFGLEQRTRYEYRHQDARRSPLTYDDQFLLRSRAYFGIREVLDPLRFGVEIQDSREFGTRFGDSDRDTNEADLQQGFAELFFEDALGPREPLRLQAGRMSFELIDRRLFARNRWRNTTNAFDGLRLRAGESKSPYELNILAVRPVERRLRRLDGSDDERVLYGATFSWRGWEPLIQIEPYYFLLDVDRRSDPALTDRLIHTPGVRVFGLIGESGWDYDANVAYQVGEDGDRTHRAFAAAGEVGYSFDAAWDPRLSFSTLYASGDEDRSDGTTQRFDRLFGAAHFLSTSDLFIWENTIAPKLRLDFAPLKDLQLDFAYGMYWLASDRDNWGATGRRIAAGGSTFIGHELEFRGVYRVNEHMNLELGYSHFIPGQVANNVVPPADNDFDRGDFVYVQMTLRL